MKKTFGLMLFFITILSSQADCTVVKSGKEEKFDGKSLTGLSIEKKSLAALNKAFPELTVTEKVFAGSLQACTSCSDNYIKCQ